MCVSLPDWLFAKAADCGPGAYGELAPELRARLKSQIAFLHHCLGESPAWNEQRRPWLDRVLTRREQPLDWALFGISGDYASGPGLLAALLPAVLAGCANEGRELLVCRLPGSGVLPLELSAALELLGQEQLFELAAPEFVALAAELNAKSGQSGRGRVVLLGETEDRPPVGGHVLPGRVTIVVDPDCGADLDLLRWAQPDARIVAAGPGCIVEGNSWLALLTDRPDAYPLTPNLLLAPGNEALWLWPGLDPALFRAHTAGIGTF